MYRLTYRLRRYATSNRYATHGLCQFQSATSNYFWEYVLNARGLLGQRFFYRASKMVPILSAPGILWLRNIRSVTQVEKYVTDDIGRLRNNRPGCGFCGRGQPLLALGSWTFNEVVWVSIRLHELITLC
jgi:hypothetical protein